MKLICEEIFLKDRVVKSVLHLSSIYPALATAYKEGTFKILQNCPDYKLAIKIIESVFPLRSEGRLIYPHVHERKNGEEKDKHGLGMITCSRHPSTDVRFFDGPQTESLEQAMGKTL